MNITINGEILEQVKSFSYLGHVKTDDEISEMEIQKRTGMEKHILNKMKRTGMEKHVLNKMKRTLTPRAQVSNPWIMTLFGAG